MKNNTLLQVDKQQNNLGEVVLYQPNEEIKLEVRVENESVWLNRQQLSILFGRDIKTIGKHITNAIKEELKGISVVANFATTATDGKTYKVSYYNIDVILSVGYRVKSANGIQFRQWANKVLKNYLLQGYAFNQRFSSIENELNKQREILNNHQEKIDFFIRTALPPFEGIFYNGQIFDAYKFINDLIRSANPKLIDALRPVLDTEYKKTVVALNIIETFYGDRFKNELKDWNIVINQINWDSPYYNPEETKVSQESKHKSQILRVETPDGQVFEEQKVLNTLIKVIQYADIEKVRNLNINVCGDNMIVAENDINERYRIAMKYIGKGLYANTCSDTPTKAAIIKQISEQLNLGLQVDFISLDGTKLEVSQSTSSRQKIKVIFPDGKEIRYNTVADTFIEVIQYAGAERVRDLNFTIAYDNLILTENQINPKYAIATKPLGNGFFVNTNIPTTHKAEILSEISEKLGLGLIVTIE